MDTRTLVLEEELDTSRLFGMFDAHLKAIETAVGVSIGARGQRVTIEGDEGAVQIASQVIQRLSRQLRNRGQVGPDDVALFISQAQEGDEITQPPPLKLSARPRPLVPRNNSQARYLDAIARHDLVIAIGPAGTGKTYLAMAAAVSAYNNKEVRRIVLTRPAVEAGERLGFLPGDLVEKINPYLRPLYDALYDMMPVEAGQKLLDRGEIEIAPLAFMRGRTLNEAFIILDEAQNTTPEQMKMFLTRFGENSKVVVTGDITQIDLPSGDMSGLVDAEALLDGMPGVATVHFSDRDVIRHPLVARIVKAYQERGAPRR
ncbi:MAG: PhoH family protein [Nitrospirota bacterium]|nr:PhoH family protein [Nitrospirota bacterium]